MKNHPTDPRGTIFQFFRPDTLRLLLEQTWEPCPYQYHRGGTFPGTRVVINGSEVPVCPIQWCFWHEGKPIAYAGEVAHTPGAVDIDRQITGRSGYGQRDIIDAAHAFYDSWDNGGVTDLRPLVTPWLGGALVVNEVLVEREEVVV